MLAPLAAPSKAMIHIMAKVNSTKPTASSASTSPVEWTVVIVWVYNHGAARSPNQTATAMPTVEVATRPNVRRLRSPGSKAGDANATACCTTKGKVRTPAKTIAAVHRSPIQAPGSKTTMQSLHGARASSHCINASSMRRERRTVRAARTTSTMETLAENSSRCPTTDWSRSDSSRRSATVIHLQTKSMWTGAALA